MLSFQHHVVHPQEVLLYTRRQLPVSPLDTLQYRVVVLSGPSRSKLVCRVIHTEASHFYAKWLRLPCPVTTVVYETGSQVAVCMPKLFAVMHGT